jgi:wobble nucleotide-excising tRNase
MEVRRLGLGNLGVEFRREQSAYGVPRFRLSLIRSPDSQLGPILSEGEHRCVALAAFLTELATADNLSGIVFDDPVCSLDHEYRETAAKRLAEEAAAGRQVIVFTHDAAFLCMLDDAAREVGAQVQYRSVSRSADACGVC